MNIQMAHNIDPKDKILGDLGDISDIELLNNQVLIAVYMRPEQTKGGLYLPDKHRDEDRYQSKVGLIVGLGPSAFREGEDGNWFGGKVFAVGDWVLFRPSDGWNITVSNVPCKILSDTQIKGTVKDVDKVW